MNLQHLARATRQRVPQAIIAALLASGMAGCGPQAAPAAGTEARDIQAIGAPRDAERKNRREADESLQPPPAGTLHYTIELSGDLHKTGPHAGEKRDAMIRRRIEVTSHMQGVLVNGGLDMANPDHPKGNKPAQLPKTVLDDLARQGDACNGNAACMMEISMKLMADPKAQEEIQRVGNQVVAMIGRTVVWSPRAPCAGHATIDDSNDSASWWENADAAGRASGLDRRKTLTHANAPFDCRPNLLSDDPAVVSHLIAAGTLLYFDKQTGTYDIVFAPSRVEAATTVNGQPGQPKQTGTPKIALSGFEGATIGQPISGKKTLDVEYEDGVPLRADINWTFTPDRS